MDYHFTLKGKWLIHLVLTLLVVGMFVSGRYIIAYFSTSTQQTVVSKDNPSVTQDEGTVVSQEQVKNELVKEKTEDYDSEEQEEHSETYKPYELEDFKNFYVSLYFLGESGDLMEASKSDLDYLIGVLIRYEDEPISIEANVNNLSGTLSIKEMETIGNERIKVIAEHLIKNGVREDRILVKNNFDLKPMTLDKENCFLNDRVTIYFTNHSKLVNDVK